MAADKKIVPPEIKEERLDKFIADCYPQETRSRMKKLINDSRVLVNGSASKPSYQVCPGDQIEIDFPVPRELKIEPENIPLDVLFEDSDLIVVNKPQGMVVHPAPGHYSGTLVNALLKHCRDLSGINGVLRPGIVHRIDKDTSGVIIAAKNDFTHQGLARQLKDHSIKREYMAVLHGSLVPKSGTIAGDIGRHPVYRKKMAVLTTGNRRSAVTHYRVIQYYKIRDRSYCQVLVELETGRTHQIRVHMAHRGYPIVGDPVYGLKKQPFYLPGQALHAWLLGFVHPRSGLYIECTAPAPAAYRKLITILEQEAEQQ